MNTDNSALCDQRYNTAISRIANLEGSQDKFVRVTTFKAIVSVTTIAIIGLFGISLANYKANVEILAALRYADIAEINSFIE